MIVIFSVEYLILAGFVIFVWRQTKSSKDKLSTWFVAALFILILWGPVAISTYKYLQYSEKTPQISYPNPPVHWYRGQP